MNSTTTEIVKKRFDDWIGKTALSYHLDMAYRKRCISAQDLEDCYNEIQIFLVAEIEAARLDSARQARREAIESIKAHAVAEGEEKGKKIYFIKLSESLKPTEEEREKKT